MIGDADEDIAKVLEGVDRVQLARGDEGVEDAGPLSALFAAGEEPVFATDLVSYPPHLAGLPPTILPTTAEEVHDARDPVALLRRVLAHREHASN
jgi:hypothetical protein